MYALTGMFTDLVLLYLYLAKIPFVLTAGVDYFLCLQDFGGRE